MHLFTGRSVLEYRYCNSRTLFYCGGGFSITIHNCGGGFSITIKTYCLKLHDRKPAVPET
jgi:hypothetical protein